MELKFSITDYIKRNGELRPIITAEINSENSSSVFEAKGAAKASAQCARYELLARKIKALVEAFYDVNITNAE